MSRNPTMLELFVFSATATAIMVGLTEEDEAKEIWLPLRSISALCGYHLEPNADPVGMLVPEALARKKGLIQ